MDNDFDDRTSAIGLFNYGHSYGKAAIALMKSRLRTPHADAPVRYLFSHSAELFLKAFLRAHGVSVTELSSRKFGHNFATLSNAAKEMGLALTDNDLAALLTFNDAILDRYIVTGSRSVLTNEQAMELCQRLSSMIGPSIFLACGLSRKAPSLSE